MTYPLMSVAIPAYNHAEFIEACLASICAQSYPELELVLVDDGSTDNTLSLAQTFVANHPGRFRRVVMYSRPNRGVSATSNECIAACSGDWVHLIGSDDLMLPEKILHQWRAICAWGDERLALVYADVEYVDRVGNVLPKVADERPAPGPDSRAYLGLFLRNPVINPTIALNRKAFQNIGGFDETLALEDWDCWLRLSASYSIARVPEVLAHYRRHGGQASRHWPRMLHAMLLTFGKFLSEHGDLIPADVRQRSFRKNLHRLWRWARRNKPAMLPKILEDAIFLFFRVPGPEDYFRYANAISTTLSLGN